MKNILVVVAHPDDEVLGCGGTIAKLIKNGHRAYSLILGEGLTARSEKRNPGKLEKKLGELKKHARSANRIIGVKECFNYDFPDNRFDAIPLLDIIKVIEKVQKHIKPDIIFTHFKDDLNIDHQMVYKAVITASRPLRGQTVKEIYSFEVPSSTEWAYPLQFSPDVFFDISGTFKIKLRAMKEYKGEIRNFPHPRSFRNIELNAECWGVKVGCRYAEAFMTVRCIK